jgi:hypothetical protein
MLYCQLNLRRANACYGPVSLAAASDSELRNLGDVSISERADESGTITFGSQSFSRWSRSSRYKALAFEMIENVRNVYNLIVGTQRELLSK